METVAVTPQALEIPLSILITGITGLVSAVVYVFHLLIASHERRAKELLEQLMTDRAKAEADREEYADKLETIVSQVTTEHEKTRNDMTKTLAENSEAIRLNTAARELSNKQISQLTPEITSIVLLKLVELGFIAGPIRSAKPTDIGGDPPGERRLNR